MTFSILGSTGSIGTQALDVARVHNYKIHALTAMKNIKLLEAQIREFKPAIAAVADEKLAKELKIAVADTNIKILSGISGVCEAAQSGENVSIVLNAIVGAAGLLPSAKIIESGKNLALANKETLVAAGKYITALAKKHNVKILPVDSEHSAIFQCLCGLDKSDINKIILTASGGPFFGKAKNELQNITPAQALKHPNWSMGAKISIDSATMMNKGLEIIEAFHLFGMDEDKIDVTVHRQSIVHSMVELKDGGLLAQMGAPDMRVPIQLALTYPSHKESPAKRLDFTKNIDLSFCPPDNDNFPAMDICRRAIKEGGVKPACVNAANEAAVELFLHGKCSFLDIAAYAEKALLKAPDIKADSLEAVFAADCETRGLFPVFTKC